MKSKLLIISLFFNTQNVYSMTFEPAELLARSNVRDSFNLPALTYLSNVAPVINNLGEVAFKVVATGENAAQGIWIKAKEDTYGKVLITAPDDLVITDPSINDQGKLVYSLFDEMSSLGVFEYDVHKLSERQVLDGKQTKLTYFTYPTITNEEAIYFRGTNGTNDRAFYRFDKTLKTIVSEGVDIQGMSSSYLFRPSINHKGEMAFKMRMGKKGDWGENNPDVIALYRPTSGNLPSISYIALDKDIDQNSKYLSFLNSVSLSNAGHIAYSAVTEDHRIAVILFSPSGESKQIALENENDVLNVETFSVKVNASGHVLFRGKDKENKRTLFFYDGISLEKIIREGDEIGADMGMAKILDNQYYPGFSGEVDLNDNDQIVFGVVILSSKDSVEWGQGIYLLNPKK
jgi:hypothetical protein